MNFLCLLCVKKGWKNDVWDRGIKSAMSTWLTIEKLGSSYQRDTLSVEMDSFNLYVRAHTSLLPLEWKKCSHCNFYQSFICTSTWVKDVCTLAISDEIQYTKYTWTIIVLRLLEKNVAQFCNLEHDRGTSRLIMWEGSLLVVDVDVKSWKQSSVSWNDHAIPRSDSITGGYGGR